MTPEQISQAANALFTAEQTNTQIGILTQQHTDMTMADAYAIQAQLVQQKVAAGREIRGWKIGLTSKAMQAALNIDIPDSGVLFDDMFFDHGATVPAGRFIQTRIEAEIAFVMGEDLAGADVSRDQVLQATQHVVPALEILDTRIQRIDAASGATRKIFDTISDNAANAGIVLGDRTHAVDAHDMRWVGCIVKRNGEVEETGLGAGVLDDPPMGIVWLVQRLAEYDLGLRAGDVVLSGSFVRPVEARPGDRFDADYGEFGRVRIDFGGG